jgi:hypothetical protein
MGFNSFFRQGHKRLFLLGYNIQSDSLVSLTGNQYKSFMLNRVNWSIAIVKDRANAFLTVTGLSLTPDVTTGSISDIRYQF